MNKFVVMKRKCDPASLSLTETKTFDDISYAKVDSCRETSINKQAIVARNVSAWNSTENTIAIDIGEACSTTSSSCGNVEKLRRPNQHKRSFQTAWCKKWEWSNYVEEKNSAMCKVCTKTWRLGLIHGVAPTANDS